MEYKDLVFLGHAFSWNEDERYLESPSFPGIRIYPSPSAGVRWKVRFPDKGRLIKFHVVGSESQRCLEGVLKMVIDSDLRKHHH